MTQKLSAVVTAESCVEPQQAVAVEDEIHNYFASESCSSQGSIDMHVSFCLLFFYLFFSHKHNELRYSTVYLESKHFPLLFNGLSN